VPGSAWHLTGCRSRGSPTYYLLSAWGCATVRAPQADAEELGRREAAVKRRDGPPKEHQMDEAGRRMVARLMDGGRATTTEDFDREEAAADAAAAAAAAATEAEAPWLERDPLDAMEMICSEEYVYVDVRSRREHDRCVCVGVCRARCSHSRGAALVLAAPSSAMSNAKTP